MKIVGTGAPEVLTISFERCELEPLLLELREQRAVVTEALAHEQSRARVGPSEAGTEAIDRLHAELVSVCRVLDQAERFEAAGTCPIEIVGPTPLMAQVLRGAAIEAAERLRTALQTIFEPGRRLSPETVRAAGLAAGACAETLCDYYFVDNHGLD